LEPFRGSLDDAMGNEIITLAFFVPVYLKCRSDHPLAKLDSSAVFVLGRLIVR